MKKFIEYAITEGQELRSRPRVRAAAQTGHRGRQEGDREDRLLRWRPGPSATRSCGPGATSPTASATRCCEASPASRRRSPSRRSPASSTRSSTSPGRRSRSSASSSSPPTTGTRSPNASAPRPFLYGTVVTSFIALLVAAPLSVAISIYLTELAPRRIRRPVATLIDMLAAIPTVILGLWGILVLGPFMRDTIEPALHSVLGFLPIFDGDPSAFSYLTAATDPHDHDHADHHQRHPRGLRDRPRRPQGGLLRARRDPLGDGPPGRPALLAPGHRRRLDPRPRPRDRRGDRGRPGDRRRRP